MHAEQRASVFVDGVFVVAQAGAVGSANFAKNGAALRHDFGDAEAIADFNQLAARNNDFAGSGESGENQENGCGAVVNDDGVFPAGETREQLTRVVVAPAASAGCQAIFEIAVW